MDCCEECGFDWTAMPADAIAVIRNGPEAIRRALAALTDGQLRTRPEPVVWSPLEYAAHTRDALAFYDDRIEQVLATDHPQFTRFDADAACDEQRSNNEDVADTLAGLTRVAERLSKRLAGLSDAQWSRVGIGSEGGERDVVTLAQRAAHEVRHHVVDLGGT